MLTGTNHASPKTRNWVFTIQVPSTTPTEGPCPVTIPLLPEQKYLHYQLERAPTTGQLHLQGFVCYTNPVRAATVEAALGGHAFIQSMRGSVKQNVEYCSKAASKVNGPWFFGDIAFQGFRSDLAAAAEIIRSGGTLRQVAEDHPLIFIRNERGLRQYASMLVEVPEFRAITIRWYWGTTNMGKTGLCYNEAGPGLYSVPGSGRWWDHYNGQDCVLFDDFSDDKDDRPSLRNLKIWLGGFPVTVEYKGGSTHLLFTKVWFTSQHEPDYYFRFAQVEDWAALKRRITFVRQITEPWRPGAPTPVNSPLPPTLSSIDD